ncbi:MAG: 2-C-methyl-D-erythritol 2,4-cyclodiphosphate synthase [Chthoniobacteraceae bacterium]
MTRTGIGYDVHRLVEERPLILGGVELAYHLGLDGHSDADVLCHAIADALLGAVGERDIGYHFPNTDPSIRGISSLEILRRVRDILAATGARIVNVDATVIAEAPKILPHRDAMIKNIAEALCVETSAIGLKATTNEHLGFIGRGEGIGSMAVASVEV